MTDEKRIGFAIDYIEAMRLRIVQNEPDRKDPKAFIYLSELKYLIELLHRCESAKEYLDFFEAKRDS